MRVALLIALATVLAAADRLPQAHPGLVWDDRRPVPDLLGLHGRVQLIIFHQSDPQENKIVGVLLGQLQAAYGADPRIVLIHVACGEGGMVAPAGFLAASDPTKDLLKAYANTSGANRFCIIGPDGVIVAIGDAKPAKPTPTGKEYHIARNKDVAALLPQCTPPWNDGVITRTPAAAPIMDAYRAGDLGGAFRLLAKADRKDAGVAGLIASLAEQRERLVAADAALLADRGRGPLRYQAFLRLGAVPALFGGTPAGKAATETLKTSAYDPKDDQAAWTGWTRLREAAARLSGLEREALLEKGFGEIIARHPDTWAGRLAARSLGR